MKRDDDGRQREEKKEGRGRTGNPESQARCRAKGNHTKHHAIIPSPVITRPEKKIRESLGKRGQNGADGGDGADGADGTQLIRSSHSQLLSAAGLLAWTSLEAPRHQKQHQKHRKHRKHRKPVMVPESLNPRMRLASSLLLRTRSTAWTDTAMSHHFCSRSELLFTHSPTLCRSRKSIACRACPQTITTLHVHNGAKLLVSTNSLIISP